MSVFVSDPTQETSVSNNKHPCYKLLSFSFKHFLLCWANVSHPDWIMAIPLLFSVLLRAAAIKTWEIELFQRTNLCSYFQAWRQTLAANMNSKGKKKSFGICFIFPPFRTSKMLFSTITTEWRPQQGNASWWHRHMIGGCSAFSFLAPARGAHLLFTFKTWAVHLFLLNIQKLIIWNLAL